MFSTVLANSAYLLVSIKKIWQEQRSRLIISHVVETEKNNWIIEPTKEDIEAIKEYESAKKSGKLVLVPLSDLTKGGHSAWLNIWFLLKRKRKSIQETTRAWPSENNLSSSHVRE